MNAWLQRTDGSREEIGLNCYIGRTVGSTVRVDSVQVSRRHAQIHAQQAENGVEYWIADLGSTNGTIRNGRRITVPSRLSHGDEIVIGDEHFVFCLDQAAPRLPTLDDQGSVTQVLEGRHVCWLLMVDVKKYTALSQSLSEEQLGQVVGGWFRRSRDAIEAAGGIVDKLLGDAIFAYWEDGPEAPTRVDAALRELEQVQRERNPDFRIVLHRGPVLLQGVAGGSNNLSGLEIIYVFRMEKVCAALGSDTIISSSARKILADHHATVPLGEHRLDGFAGSHAFYRLASETETRSSS